MAARLKSCTHGPSRPPAHIIMLELRAASLWTDALLQHAPNAPPKTASSSRVLRTLRARTERPESTRDLRIVALSSRTDDESAQRCDPQQALGTAASAMLIAVFGKSYRLPITASWKRGQGALPQSQHGQAWDLPTVRCATARGVRNCSGCSGRTHGGGARAARASAGG